MPGLMCRKWELGVGERAHHEMHQGMLRAYSTDPLGYRQGPERYHNVVSFIGDTGVGKSHTISQLLAEDDEYNQDRNKMPVHHDDPKIAHEKGSTSSNVKIYTTHSMIPTRDIKIRLLDFEGSNGTRVPMTLQEKYDLQGTKEEEDWLSDRLNVVTEDFPKAAYCLSEAIVMIGREPFSNTRYEERLKHIASAGEVVRNMPTPVKPVLIIVCNKYRWYDLDDKDGTSVIPSHATPLHLSLTFPGLQLFDVANSTKQFFDANNPEVRESIKTNFRDFHCIYNVFKVRGFRV